MMKMAKRDPRRALTVLRPCGNAFWWSEKNFFGTLRFVLIIYVYIPSFIVFGKWSIAENDQFKESDLIPKSDLSLESDQYP